MQEAEYRNRKEGMETGRTEEEIRTEGTAARGEREEGKRKCRRLSSQKRAEADERKRKASGKARKRSESGTEGKHRWNGCGSETGKDERKQTDSQVPKAGREARETGRKRRRKTGKPKGRTVALDKPLRGKDRKKGKEETEG